MNMEKERKQKPRGIRNNNPLAINQLKSHVISITWDLSSMGIALNKGILRDLSILSIVNFRAIAGKVRISTRGISRGRRGFRPLRRFG